MLRTSEPRVDFPRAKKSNQSRWITEDHSRRNQQDRRNVAIITVTDLARYLKHKTVMPTPITTTADSDLADAAYIMLRNRISGLPVVNPNGILTGIATKTDVVKALAAHA